MWYTRCCSTVFSIDSPHVDEVLSERHRLCVARHRDSAIEVGSGLAVVAVGDADHGAAQLPTFLIHTFRDIQSLTRWNIALDSLFLFRCIFRLKEN